MAERPTQVDEWETVSATGGDEWETVTPQQAKPDPTLGGFADNAVRSGLKFARDTLGGFKALHDATPLPSRVEMVASALPGIGPVVSGARAVRGWMSGDTPTAIKNVAQGMAQHYGTRYGSPSQAAQTFYEDPVGALSDVSVAAGGASALANISRLPRVASALNKVSLATNPLTLPTKIPGVQPLVNRAAEGLYGMNLKPSTTLPARDRQAIVRMGLTERIPVSRGGLEKAAENIDTINREVAGKIASGAASGKTADPAKVVAETARSRDVFRSQVNPRSDVAAIDNATKEFLETQAGATAANPMGSPIPLDKAQKLKQGTYKKIRESYGEMSTATKEAQKDLARGLKDEIYGHFPELKDLGQKEKVLIQLEEQLERAVAREGNKLPISLNTPLTIGAAGPTAGMLQHLIDRMPGLTSRIAAAVYKANGTAMKPAQIRQIINAASATERDKQQ